MPDSSITGADVRRIVARVIGRRGAPTRIRSDNGSEFICEALVNWLPSKGAKSIPVAAGSPWENGYIESFHSRLRDEFLELVEFEDVADAQDEGVLIPAGIQRGPASQLPGLRDAKRVQRWPVTTGESTPVAKSAHILVFNFFVENSHFGWTKKRGAAHLIPRWAINRKRYFLFMRNLGVSCIIHDSEEFPSPQPYAVTERTHTAVSPNATSSMLWIARRRRRASGPGWLATDLWASAWSCGRPGRTSRDATSRPAGHSTRQGKSGRAVAFACGRGGCQPGARNACSTSRRLCKV